MIKSHREGGILCCGTKSELSVEKSGLVLGHAYTIVFLQINLAKFIWETISAH